MATTVHYRMSILDGTLYSTTTTVLSPAASAPHSDDFKVTTKSDLSGWQPYMRPPRGERGSFSLDKGSSTVGTYKVTLLDKRTDTDNINRWVSAFIGDTDKKLTIVGKKAYIEESIDDGATWTPFFVGRVNDVNLESLLEVSFTIADSLDLLKQDVFVTLPRVSYLVHRSIWPLGFTTDLETTDGGSKYAAVQGFRVTGVRGTGNDANNVRFLTLDNTSMNRPDNVWGFGNRYPQIDTSTGYNTTIGQEPFRLRVSKGGSVYHYRIDSVRSQSNTYKQADTFNSIQELLIRELPVDDHQWSDISNIQVGDTFDVWAYQYRSDDKKVSSFFLNEDPYTITRDILDGKFFSSGSLTIPVTIPYDESSIDALETTQVLPETVYRVKDSMEAAKFIEEHVCRPFALGYTFEPQLDGGVPKSVMKFFSTRQPTTLTGLPTISGADVVSNSSRNWSSEEPVLYVVGTFYMENAKNRLQSNYTDMSFEPTSENSYLYVHGFETNTDSSYKPVSIDFMGLRGINTNASNQGEEAKLQNVPAYQYVLNKTARFVQDYFYRNRYGNPVVRLSTARNSTTTSIEVGDFTLVEVDALPNQATHTRGGTRVMQVVQKTPNGLQFDFQLVDAGVNEVMNTPSLGSLSSPVDGNVQFTITTDEEADVEVEYAVVLNGGSVPASSSDQWLLSGVYPLNDDVMTVTLSNLPEGRRIYVRIRAVAPVNVGMKLPSPWVTSAGIDLSNIDAPTSVVVSAITSRSARASWTNTNADYLLEVWLASPADTPDTIIATLPVSSSMYLLRGLDKNSSTSHTVGIRYVDGVGGFSPFATSTFTASGSAAILDAPAAILLYVTE